MSASVHMDSYPIIVSIEIKTTADQLYEIVTDMDTWCKFYPSTVQAAYINSKKSKVGAKILEKYMDQGYAWLEHTVIEDRKENNTRYWTINGRISGGQPFYTTKPSEWPAMSDLRTTIEYIFEQIDPSTVRWTRRQTSYTLDKSPVGLQIYEGFAGQFLSTVRIALEYYQQLVKEYVESKSYDSGSPNLATSIKTAKM
jgi:hypothetical protein